MKLQVMKTKEPNIKCYLLRFVCGPAGILDGVIETVTFGKYSFCFKLEIAKLLARARIYG
ncbi:MAG: hypothetical protein WC055_01035 [Melioribacteraceae bacterium]